MRLITLNTPLQSTLDIEQISPRWRRETEKMVDKMASGALISLPGIAGYALRVASTAAPSLLQFAILAPPMPAIAGTRTPTPILTVTAAIADSRYAADLWRDTVQRAFDAHPKWSADSPPQASWCALSPWAALARVPAPSATAASDLAKALVWRWATTDRSG
ncbi:hypothetical protein [Magnetofaba australis]|uniref:Uncharacterized protein n=1 Tax=Magnetofaba australis IT-1 TaxID=1434232 RepID=A0A1Y2K8P2_9PROT|nr:hypothetical protein [Magnetofaba australis]OSM06999.1 hypothetical protein MAIT1_00099 [Magnetofaba australis IT-1]